MIDYSNKRFLVVDDFSEFRTAVAGMLRMMAVKQVDSAPRGEDAIALCRNNKYDVILHDYNLGAGKNGQQVLEELHHLKLISPHCIFVMCTAESSQAMVMSALECEPDAYLTKPFNRASLQQRLDKLVERKTALKPILDALAREDHRGVLAACEKVTLEHKRFAPQCLRYQANALKALGQRAELEKLLQAQLTDRPMPWALIALGQLWLEQGKLDQALELFRSAISQFPMLPALFDGLAAVLEAMGEPKQAQEYIEQGIKISPNSLQRQQSLGKLAKANGDFDNAVRAYRQAVDLGHNSQFRNPESHLGLALSLNDQAGDQAPNPRALLEIRKTLGDLGKSWKGDTNLQVRAQLAEASTLVKTGDRLGADKLIQQAAAQFSELDTFFSAEVALEVAGQLKALGQEDHAKNILHTCAEMYGDDANVMASIAQQTDDPAILNGGKAAQELNRQGIRLYQQQQFADALPLFRQAQTLQPRNISFALNTAQSLLRMLLAQPDPELKAQCLHCLEQVRSMPDSDARHERYQKLCKTVAGL
ncbi:tetratricopeptide repeat-containing response regulator [Halopseudomonas pelagia]|uniref:tetratricopeptide repeat-containing response regulator n=1 Tax=Halopseudomonas pelagia TaxID=553151 RepID=UPI0003AACAAF|nr:tetratricopeptide repeat-containing response regulator [Halopseudomonas pelagia]|tara:strand:- start:616 stop:2220 length:1605 start_codon:yes stop_codon:yes gene_type:complete